MHLFLVKMLEDPAKLKEYLAEKCVTETFGVPRAFEYLHWLNAEQQSMLDSDSTMTQCVDNFGAYAQFER